VRRRRNLRRSLRREEGCWPRCSGIGRGCRTLRLRRKAFSV
jgi:hypothetical protein